MPSSEEKKKRKKEKAEKLRLKQEEALKKAHEEEKKATKKTASGTTSKQKEEEEEDPEEMSSKGYKISSDELSSGQFSTLFKAKHNDEDIVARVVYKHDKEANFLNKLVPRFVTILRALDERHPNIISTLDVFDSSKRIIILMRPTTGGSLYDFIDKQSNSTDESQCRLWAQQLVSALSYLHINGIVHRDLRTERILLDEKKCLKISGFTYSRLWLNVKKNSKELSNTCVGTGPYCAPETLSGESYDPRTADVWAFGVIVFFIWNKSYPFDYNMTHKLLAQQKSNEWTNRIRSESNDLIKDFFRKTFEVNHSQRQPIVDILKDKWIDSKITVVLDESLKALDENSAAKDTPKEKTQTSKNEILKPIEIPTGTNDSSQVKNEGAKEKDETKKTMEDGSKQKETSNGSDQTPKGKEGNSKGKEETPKEKSGTKSGQNNDKSNSNATKKEENKESGAKEGTDDSDDVNDLSDDDDDDITKEKEEKPKLSNEKSEEKAPKTKTITTSSKREVSDNVLRPDILEQLKKDFLSLK